MTTKEERAREYAYKIAKPILRSMAPHMSRVQWADSLVDAVIHGYRIAIEDAANAAEDVGIEHDQRGDPTMGIGAYRAATEIRALASGKKGE